MLERQYSYSLQEMKNKIWYWYRSLDTLFCRCGPGLALPGTFQYVMDRVLFALLRLGHEVASWRDLVPEGAFEGHVKAAEGIPDFSQIARKSCFSWSNRVKSKLFPRCLLNVLYINSSYLVNHTLVLHAICTVQSELPFIDTYFFNESENVNNWFAVCWGTCWIRYDSDRSKCHTWVIMSN